MITVTKVVNARQAAAYYAESDDYYSEGRSAPAEIFGEGAAALGLAGAISRERAARFYEALEGRLAGGQVGDAGRHTPGWDVTFSAPKSFSIAALTGDARLIEAHDRAVRAALAHLECHAIVSRQRSADGKYAWHSAVMVAAVYRHSTSRNLDPQLHSHSVIANAALLGDGSWRSLDSREIYAAQAEANTVYMAAIAHAAREAGYTVDWSINDRGHPAFELREIPEALRDRWSSRRAEIEAALRARGLDPSTASASAKESATLDTRSAKDLSVDRAALTAHWLETAVAAGYDPDAARAGTLTPADRAQSADAAVAAAVAHLAERDARFSHRDLEHPARLAGQGRASDADIGAAINRARGAGILIDRKSWGRNAGGQRGYREGFTTAEGVRIEREILALARKLEGANGVRICEQRGVVISEAALTREIDRAIGAQEARTGFKMTDEQREATRGILESPSRLHVLQGHAGTAKTTSTLAAVCSEAQRNGWEVSAIAPTTSAAGTLGDALGTESTTVAALLSSRPEPSRAQHLWVVDEAGMISAADMRDLLRRAEASGAHVILSGDTRQIGSVGAGAAYAQIATTVKSEHKYELTQIVRQSNALLREAVYSAIDGKVRDALAKADTRVIKGRDSQIAAAAARFEEAVNFGRAALVVTLSRADRADVNAAIHQARVAAGSVTDVRELCILESRQLTHAQLRDAARYQVGDVVEWGSALRLFDSPERGEQLRVIGVRDGVVTAEREDGSEWRFRTAEQRGHWDLATVRTIEVGAGDQIIGRAAIRSEAGERIASGTRLVVERVESGRLIARNEAGKSFEIDAGRALRLDLGYAMTADQAQGKTVDVAIGVMRAGQENLADQSRLYVAISRARDEGVVITDDAAKLADTIEKNRGGRETALEPAQPQVALDVEWLDDEAEARQQPSQGASPDVQADVDESIELSR